MKPRQQCAALALLACLAFSSAKCVNWCSQHGLCIGSGDEAYCDCEIGYSGAGCEKSECSCLCWECDNSCQQTCTDGACFVF
jgi:hypothetical protein